MIRSLLLAAPFLLALALGAAASAQTVTVSAASSLGEAFEELAALFEARHAGVEVALNLAGSSTLAAQIVQGAPVDVFASANAAQMQVVVDAGLVAGEPAIFAHNRLVVITPPDSPVAELADLAAAGVLLVLAGPEVPAGDYARRALAAMEVRFGAGFAQRVLTNLASEEPNVRQVAAKVVLGEADAAIVYATDAALLSGVRVIDIPEALNAVADYPVAVLRDAPRPELAREFVALLRSPEGARILAARGFRVGS